MALPLPPRNLNPIPNSPFYYPNEEALASSTGPLIVGAGLAVDYSSGQLQAAGGGLANITATLPLYKTGTASNPVINIETANKFRLGAVQVGSNLELSGVGVIDVLQATTAQKGIVQLADNVSSTSKFLALTANQGYLLQQQINALSFTTDLIFSGTFDPLVPEMVVVTTKGLEAGFVQGANLPLPSAENEGHFVIVAERGTYTPPGSLTPVDAHVGSWFLSDGTNWRYLRVSEQVPSATETSEGIIRLATLQEALDGVNDTAAITPYKMAQVSVEKGNFTAKGDILTATGAGVTTALPVGTDGQLLEADSTCAEGLKWVDKPPSIPCSVIQNKGSIVVGSSPAVPTSLPIGLNNQFLRVNYSCPNGLEWVTATNTFAIPCSTLTNPGDLITANSPGNPIALPRPSTDGSVLQVNTACVSTGGLTWVDNPYICCSDFPFAGQGSLLVSSCNAVSGRYFTSFSAGNFPAGSILVTDCNCSNYMKWCQEIRYISNTCLGTVPGTLVTRGQGTAGNDWSCSLVPGADGTILTANSACDLGLEWAEPFCQTTAAETITSCSSIDKGESQEFAILPSFNYPIGTYLVNVWGSALNDGGSACMQLFFEGQPMQRIEYPNTRSEIPFSQTALVCNDIPANGGNACWHSCNSSTGAGPQTVNFYAYMTAIRIS